MFEFVDTGFESLTLDGIGFFVGEFSEFDEVGFEIEHGLFPFLVGVMHLGFDLFEMAAQHGAQIGEGGFHFSAVDDSVEHSGSIDEFGGLKIVGDFEDLGLSADSGTGESDEGFGFGDDDIGDGGVAGENSGHGWIGENGDVGDAVLAAFINGGGGFGHLHEAQEAFLHAGSAGGAEDDNWALAFDAAFEGSGDFFTVD